MFRGKTTIKAIVGEEEFLRQTLLEDGVIHSQHARLTPLTGGVSSEIYRVDDGERTFVVKRALKKLRVDQSWYADPVRNKHEQAFLRYVATFRPDAIPALYPSKSAAEYFCMEYLEGFSNWKSDLLEGVCDIQLAGKAGELLAQIHERSRGDPVPKRMFATIANFEQLRIDPYLRATAAMHPELASRILAEAVRLRRSHEALVHGDYSPKNLLHRDGRLVAVDCEVAWYGEPAFDLAFLLNHLLLKALYHVPKQLPFANMTSAVCQSYQRASPHALSVFTRTARLLPILMLARIDGKSPVEYLNSDAQTHNVREFAAEQILSSAPANLHRLITDWFQRLRRLSQ